MTTKPPRGWQAKLIRYGFTGGIAAFVDLGGFMALLSMGLLLPVAASLSFLAASVVNYMLSVHFVFSARMTIRAYLRFLMFASLGLVINVTVTIVADDAVGLSPLLAKSAGILIAFGVNFLLNLKFVFPEHQDTTSRLR
jgi:putative flippase GtrA